MKPNWFGRFAYDDRDDWLVELANRQSNEIDKLIQDRALDRDQLACQAQMIKNLREEDTGQTQ